MKTGKSAGGHTATAWRRVEGVHLPEVFL